MSISIAISMWQVKRNRKNPLRLFLRVWGKKNTECPVFCCLVVNIYVDSTIFTGEVAFLQCILGHSK